MIWAWIAVGVFVIFAATALTGAPYVPTRRKDLSRAFTELYKLEPLDTLIDIGSGDGLVLREAARRGANAVGYEINPFLFVFSRLMSRDGPGVRVHLANFWRASFPDGTTVVYTFGDGRDIERMAEKVQREATRLGKRLAFISYAFEVKSMKKHKTVGAHHLYFMEP